MQATDFILAKRSGLAHDREDIHAFLHGYLAGDIPDYQVAAWLMAVCWRGMTSRETADLTSIMARSGEVLDLEGLPHAVDKHSTGGVGDKTSLVLAPLLASCGATVAKMSGRGLGHTGGTIDKLESIPGFRAILDDATFYQQAREVGVVITGQSKRLAPADGLLYALRDATATVESLPLIASSIMSKKLAGGAKAMVLDVKVGGGAFMKTPAEVRELAQAMIAIGHHAGRRVRAVLSNMQEPLGRAVGNALEVQEAVRCLQGEGPEDLSELCLTLATEVLAASGLPHERSLIAANLKQGRAYERFEAWICAQGGKADSWEALELAPGRSQLTAWKEGVLAGIDALGVGQAVGILGGGRSRKGEDIDRGVGVVLHAKVGDKVAASAPLVSIYHRHGRGLEEAIALLRKAFQLRESGAPLPLVLEAVREVGGL